MRGARERRRLMFVRACTQAIVQIVTLSLCSNQEFRELRFIDATFRTESASNMCFILAEHRLAIEQLFDVIARQLGLPEHGGGRT